MSIIHRLRQRPDHHKHAIGLVVSFFVTALILGVWLTVRPFTSDTDNAVIVIDQDGNRVDNANLSVVQSDVAAGIGAFATGTRSR
ncbi:MAG TPA: hypothetical protein PLF31_00945 [Candidatus Paceibacterota bacterium]|nr:hypothetical protein [Candidatus Paceibacterota bacterium]